MNVETGQERDGGRGALAGLHRHDAAALAAGADLGTSGTDPSPTLGTSLPSSGLDGAEAAPPHGEGERRKRPRTPSPQDVHPRTQEAMKRRAIRRLEGTTKPEPSVVPPPGAGPSSATMHALEPCESYRVTREARVALSGFWGPLKPGRVIRKDSYATQDWKTLTTAYRTALGLEPVGPAAAEGA